MGWNSVVGQSTIIRLLQRAISSNRLPHAVLLTGTDGAGTLALAIAVARVLVCEKRSSQVVDACGACASCRQASSLQHPNITVVTALPAGKADTESDLADEVVEELATQLRTIAQDPYVPFGLLNATQIRIGQIRELKRQLSMSAVQGGSRVVIVSHAEEMTVEAANAFLKTLEEPHPNVHIILTTPLPGRLLSTITSRCQQLRIPAIDDDEVITTLVAEGVPSTDAALVASVAGGDLTRARSLLREDLQTERTEAINLLRVALKGRDYRVDLVEAIEAAADRKDRRKATMLLQFMATWMLDVQTIAAIGPEAHIVNYDMRDAVVRFADGFGTANMSDALSIIETAMRDIRRNVTVGLVLLSAMLQLRKLLHDAARTASKAS